MHCACSWHESAVYVRATVNAGLEGGAVEFARKGSCTAVKARVVICRGSGHGAYSAAGLYSKVVPTDIHGGSLASVCCRFRDCQAFHTRINWF